MRSDQIVTNLGPKLQAGRLGRRYPGRAYAAFRSSEGLTQEELAFEAEIDLTYMGGIERGKRNPSLLVMARIAEALSVPLPKLLGE